MKRISRSAALEMIHGKDLVELTNEELADMLDILYSHRGVSYEVSRDHEYSFESKTENEEKEPSIEFRLSRLEKEPGIKK